jgi:AraC-like DNA-binding protein
MTAIANPIEVRFYPPPADLKRYFTTFYFTRFKLADGEVLEDALQPEWAGLRLFDRPGIAAWVDGGDRVSGARFVATGPSVKPTHFQIGPCSFWGVGLLPLGWAQFVGAPAGDHANIVVDGLTHPTFRQFVPLLAELHDTGRNEAAQLERFIAFFRSRLGDATPDRRRILAIHEAMVDLEVTTVAQLVDRVGASQRTVERICHRDFGFSPKQLLRRQRFMRSLAQFMLDPSLKWIGAIDSHYHDQAQFVRDFHDFMGMSPRAYANLPHPVLKTFMHERARVAGAAVQTMDLPAGVSLPEDESAGRAA